jgi:DNA-directed RNA polymerase subunit RPC12/RpoP
LVFTSSSCVGWLISNNLDLSTNNISCTNCISSSIVKERKKQPRSTFY